MTECDSGDAQGDAARMFTLEEAARALAEQQRDVVRAPWLVTHAFESQRVVRRLERARRHLSTGAPKALTLRPAAEWFLDNYYLIRRVALQVEQDLPDGFFRRLPRIASGPASGRPRIEALSQRLIGRIGVVVELPDLYRFIDAYQGISPLTIAELWAFPTMLRATVLRHLLRCLGALRVPVHDALARSAPASASEVDTVESTDVDFAASAGIERAIRALRVLDSVDWGAFVEKSSRVEAILRTDPAGTYALMDFVTCDSYRKVVESLAWATRCGEEEVARLAVSLARQGTANERSGFVGYYLEAEGRGELEARLGYVPVGRERVRRAVLRRPTVSYLVPIALLTWLPMVALAWYLAQPPRSGSLVSILVAVSFALVPASSVAIASLNAFMARLVPPRTLPKLDFEKGIPREFRTLVVIPTLLGRGAEVAAMLRQIELHYLANPDPGLQFALLTDHVDSRSPADSTEATLLLEGVSRGIAELNEKHSRGGSAPFHLLHRDGLWNQSERRYMGWERKRGKLEELNRLLRGDRHTSYSRHVGEPDGLRGIRFVITLDSDTELPLGSARRLVGLLAHPLNRAVFDSETGRVSAGYTVVQPRVETSPSSPRQSWFARIFSGEVGFDIYSHACSEVYQDLFGSGIYVGKGIYDVDAFLRSVEGRVPENALVSHDLFEGVHGRTALASDIVLFEGYPESYATFAARMHRWVRGDWQLLPWLLARVPAPQGGRLWNKLSYIDRWKIADNLRRSLAGPLLLGLLVLGWLWLPGGPFFWSLAALALVFGPSSLGVLSSSRMRSETLARCGLAVVFLAYEAGVVVDAVVRVGVRRVFTRRLMLQWTSAAHSAFAIASRSQRSMYWRTMSASPLFAVVVGLLVAAVRPSALPVAAPFLAMWLLAPEVACRLSRAPRIQRSGITSKERAKLRLLARRTWRFFDEFVGPNDQWLPIDNYQERPHEQTAHRTSPTNIGLTLVATLSAFDFGYIGPSELALRLRRAFDSIARMTHYQGHLFNWYDTRNLEPLPPRYVSTVDSGNLAACLLALKQGCREMASTPVLRAASWDGLRDSIDLLEEVVESAPGAAVGSLGALIARMQRMALQGRDDLEGSYATLLMLCEETTPELDGELLTFLGTGAHRHEADLLHALREAVDGLHEHLRDMRREIDALLPWLALGDEALAVGLDLPGNLRLEEIPAVAASLRSRLEASDTQRRGSGAEPGARELPTKRLDEALRTGAGNAQTLLDELVALAARAEVEVREMDFTLLYDQERRLFHIGYNASLDQLDPHYYDLLASEARLASFVAIVKRDVPPSHWYALGRPLTRLNGLPVLVSWGGTMFEYLMPDLFMRSQADTLLARTNLAVVDAQIAYGRESRVPWGISESAYAGVDAEHTYQYRSFGVPGLGFKRGLEEDRVVAPYASILAVSIRPRSVFENFVELESLGMLGTYGLFESLDLTPSRAASHGADGPAMSIVRSYMAHHQGMLLIALGNALNERSMVARFHTDTAVATGEALLNERPPSATPGEWPATTKGSKARHAEVEVAEPRDAPPSWLARPRDRPQAFVLSNGRLSSVVTGAGGGGLRWRGLALTRYEADETREEDGVWLYLRDEVNRRVWFATSAGGRTTFSMHQAELHRRKEGISIHVEIAIAPGDDVEVRRVTLRNETTRDRAITLTSAGRPLLLDSKQASVHPAFASLFVESELVADIDALLFARRPRSAADEPAVLVHALVSEDEAVTFVGYESDRGDFYGRGGSLRAPRALDPEREARKGRVGAVLDPVMSLTARVELMPRGSVTLAFVTTVARSRGVAIGLARKYGSMHAVRWMFRDAERESVRRLHRTKLEPSLLPTVQRLYSALLFADPRLSVAADERTHTHASQRRLWARGISGDDPIVLVRVEDPEAPILRETLAAQRFLRSCGVRIDLVVLDEHPSGYLSDGPGTLANLLALNDTEGWRNRDGGVFVVSVDQVPEPEQRHLEACARVVLDTRDRSLAMRLERLAESPPSMPRFAATLPPEPYEQARPRPAVLYDNGTGGFSEDGREYIVDVLAGRPTPAPWCNVLANPEFGCLVSESSLGTTWSLNCGENRLTPWRNDPVLDTPSEVLYLRDEETAQVWSPTPRPAGQNGHTRVRHGAGYTTYERVSHGLEQQLTVFVPPGASVKVVRLRVKNTLSRHRRLTATYYAEWVLGSQRAKQRAYIVSELNRKCACLLVVGGE